MFRLTNVKPITPMRKLSQVPFPERAKIKPKFAAGVVIGAMTAMDCPNTSPKGRQSGFSP